MLTEHRIEMYSAFVRMLSVLWQLDVRWPCVFRTNIQEDVDIIFESWARDNGLPARVLRHHHHSLRNRGDGQVRTVPILAPLINHYRVAQVRQWLTGWLTGADTLVPSILGIDPSTWRHIAISSEATRNSNSSSLLNPVRLHKRRISWILLIMMVCTWWCSASCT